MANSYCLNRNTKIAFETIIFVLNNIIIDKFIEKIFLHVKNQMSCKKSHIIFLFLFYS